VAYFIFFLMIKMLLSGTYLKKAVEHYQRVKLNGKTKEGYSKSDSASAGLSAAFASFAVVVGILFFMMELIVLFYAINTALVCTKPGPERIVNVVLAVTFTIPYMLLNLLFNKCTKSTLRKQYKK
jgi:hypothetical protein